MKKRYIKAIRTSDYREEELPIEECINRYAEDNDLIIIQFQIHNCTNASVLYEENFERAYAEEFVDFPYGCSYGAVTTWICSNCGSKALSENRCLHCNAKIFPKPSN